MAWSRRNTEDDLKHLVLSNFPGNKYILASSLVVFLEFFNDKFLLQMTFRELSHMFDLFITEFKA